MLSASVQLSAPEDYTGGELELAGLGHAAADQGAMVIFPSYMLHKVHPVRSGTRLSLVMWFLGSDQGFWHAAEHSYKQASLPVAEGGHGPEFIPAKQTLADLLRDWEQHEQAAALYQEVLDLLDDGNAASTDEDPDEDQMRRFGGRRVLGKGALAVAYVLFAAAGGSVLLAVVAALQV